MRKKLIVIVVLLVLSVGILAIGVDKSETGYDHLFRNNAERTAKDVLMCYSEDAIPYDEVRSFENWQELLVLGVIPEVDGMNEFYAQGDYLADGTLIELTLYWFYTPESETEDRQQMILNIYPIPPEDPEKRDGYTIIDKSKVTATEIDGITVYGDGNGETMGKDLIFIRPDGVEYQLSSLKSTPVDVMAETMLFFLRNGVDFTVFSMENGMDPKGEWESASTWEPVYTGEAREWEHQIPWAFDELEGENRAWNQDEGMTAAGDIGYHGGDLPGFAGYYINCSGTLTVALVEPQVELLEEYAKESSVGFWIIDAEYTLEELESASDELSNQIYEWIKENPESKLQFGFTTTDIEKNRYVVELYGPSLEPFYAEFDNLPPCVEVILHAVEDASMEAEIPREPETTWSALDGILTVSVLQPEYPVGVDTITMVLENNSLGQVMYGESFSVEKFVDGEWVDVSGALAFNAIGLGLEEYDRKTLSVNTVMFPAPLGVGLYHIIGTNLSYTEENGSSVTVTEKYVVEFLVTEDAPEPTGELPDKEGIWLTEWEIIAEDEIGFPIKNPYAAGLIYDIMAEEGLQNLGINIYDRSTGEKLTEEPLWFWADYYQDIHQGENGAILVESEGMTYLIDVVDGEVVITEQNEPYDEQIPREPVTRAETYYGEISIAMEQGNYPAGADTIAFIITNNTEYDLTTENLMPCSELVNWEYNYCFRVLPEGMTPEEELFQDPVIFSLSAGESKRVEMDLDQWYVSEYSEEGGETQHSLGRSIYTMSFNRRTFSFSDGSELTASLTVEFVLE